MRHTQMVKMPAVAWFCDVLSTVELPTAIKEWAETQRNGGYDVSLLGTCNFRANLFGLEFCITPMATQNMMGFFRHREKWGLCICSVCLSEGTTQQAQQHIIFGYVWFERVLLFNMTADMFKQVFGFLEAMQPSAECWSLGLGCVEPVRPQEVGTRSCDGGLQA